MSTTSSTCRHDFHLYILDFSKMFFPDAQSARREMMIKVLPSLILLWSNVSFATSMAGPFNLKRTIYLSSCEVSLQCRLRECEFEASCGNSAIRLGLDEMKRVGAINPSRLKVLSEPGGFEIGDFYVEFEEFCKAPGNLKCLVSVHILDGKVSGEPSRKRLLLQNDPRK